MIDDRPVIGIPMRLPPDRGGATTGPLPEIETLADRLVELVRLAGAEPLVLGEDLQGLGDCDAFLVPGGGDVEPGRYGGPAGDPTLSGVSEAQDDLDIAVLRHALGTGRPVLGVCRGMQLLNVVAGGTLHPDLPESSVVHRNPPAPVFAFVEHAVRLLPGSRCADAYGTTDGIVVTSGHHQAVAEVGDGLRPSALAEDGLVEALESVDPARWAVGVHWHPEAEATAPALRLPLVRALVDAAAHPPERVYQTP